MNVLKSMMVAAAGMRAQGSRMRVIAQNMANANSTPNAAGEAPYRRQVPTFENVMNRELGMATVQMTKTVADQSPFRKKFDPGHPAADEMGYIQLPNVNGLIEMMDMREAQQSYEANLNLIKSTQKMMSSTVDLLRRS